MKAILEFDLDNQDDSNKYKHYNRSIDYSIALWEISQIQSHFKHYHSKPSYQQVLEYINEVFNDNNININELS